MASSDEEGEIVPECVTNYHLVDYKEELISFSILPLQWSEGEILDGLRMQISLCGTADSGLQKIYKQVVAWKFELSYVQPEISVLSKDRKWIKLHSPRKSFEYIIRTILIAVHCLHFVKKNPEASGKSVWNHVQEAFSSYDNKPSENDLFDHIPLMSEAATRDKELAKSEYLLTFLMGKPTMKKVAFHEDVRITKKSKFIVDEDDDDYDDADESDENEDDLFDTVCAICDNGGDLLCCEGRCLRSFHATIDAGAESLCESLGYSDAQVEAIQNFLCKNCQYQRHQCFVCGMLGSSDKSSNAEVFPCISATCGHFYHPECAAKLLHPGNETQAEELQKKIAAGESFTCPVHKCFVCKQGENKKNYELQFAMCRRCPMAYHRKCLPGKIAFECNNDENIKQRAWDGLLQNRVLIYCMEHKIIKEIGTPERNHIIFPDVEEKKKKHTSEEVLSSKEKVVAKKRSMVFEDFPTKRTTVKMPKQVGKAYSAVMDGDSIKKIEKIFSRQGFDPSKNPKVTSVTRNSCKDNIKSLSVKTYKSSTTDENKLSLRDNKLNLLLNMESCPVKRKQQNMTCSKKENTISAMPVMKQASSSRPSVDAEMEKRIVALMKNSTTSFSSEEFINNQKVPSTYAYSKNVLDKTITRGKVEVSVKAVRTALQKLEEGCSIEDAWAVCEPEILNQIIRWKFVMHARGKLYGQRLKICEKKLKVYLAPFLHGMRYTSFGRHFTKVDKLKEIVNRLHWYVQNGDMIVDFCCGANDFSWLMKEKLDKMGKRCSFKNYDLHQPKNDFSFEKRDWMGVHLKELPTGSQLIMGLNPPFGVKASLANKFIDKALQFKPKLLILIVPMETKRLDRKKAAYDLIWEDEKILSGKSFYLPGSVDVHDKQLEQWNLKTPPLYLWSRPDWTARHKAIAQKHGHLFKDQEKFHVEENSVETVVSNYLMEEDRDYYYSEDFSNLINDYGNLSSILDDLPEESDETELEATRPTAPGEPKESPSPSDGSNEGQKNDDRRKKLPLENLDEMQYEGKQGKGQTETSRQGEHDGGRPLQTDEMYVDLETNEMYVDMELSSPFNSPFNCTDLQSLLDDPQFEALETPTDLKAREDGFRHLQPSTSEHDLEFRTEYGGIRTSIPNDRESRYSTMKEDHFPSGTHKWLNSTNLGLNTRSRNLEDQFPGYINDNVDNFGWKSYQNELEEKHSMETDIRSRLPLYGQQDYGSLPQGRILPNQDSQFHKQYAPQLDKLNHARMNALESQTPLVRRSVNYAALEPQPGIHADLSDR